jgi:hypothetical protein
MIIHIVLEFKDGGVVGLALIFISIFVVGTTSLHIMG